MDGLWPRWFQRCNSRTKAPTFALACQCIWGCVFIAVGQMRVLIQYFSFCNFFFYALAVTCVFLLRRVGLTGNYQTPYHPLFPVVFLLITLVVVINAVVARPLVSATALAFITLSLPASFLFSRNEGAESEEIPLLSTRVTPHRNRQRSTLSTTSVDLSEEYTFGAGI